jgi:uncharacterized protein YutE (UPF0331/DUF86 family)
MGIMTELDYEGVGKKLIGMTKRLTRLSVHQSLTFAGYLQDEDRQATIERYLEIIIQAAIDINKMLLAHRGIDLAELKNSETFTIAGELGILSTELATRLSLSAGFRNVLAHLYDDIIPEMAYQALQRAVVDYPRYIQQIETYLNALEEDE